jgi:hypothetical protein
MEKERERVRERDSERERLTEKKVQESDLQRKRHRKHGADGVKGGERAHAPAGNSLACSEQDQKLGSAGSFSSFSSCEARPDL